MDKATLLLSLVLAQSPQADLRCVPTGENYVYDCVVTLTRAGKPVEGAQITVGADMPSMPMAHQVRPANAKRGTKAGEYTFRLDLEMLGEWAVKLRLSGPVRDQLILHYEFDGRGAMRKR